MNTTNIRSTIKHLTNNKYHALLNVFGLSVGFLFFFHISQYVAYEKAYDSFWPNHERIFRVNYDISQAGEQVLHSTKTPRGLFHVLKSDLPEIEQAGIAYVEQVLVRYEDRYFSDQPDLWVEGDFYDMFNMELLRGSASLNVPYTCIISASKAKEIFGEEDPIGKVLVVNEGMRHEITGVFKDLPTNSHLHFDYFMPIRTWVTMEVIPDVDGFYGSGWWTYVKLSEGASPAVVERKLETIVEKYFTHLPQQNREGKLSLQALTELHYSSLRDGELGVSTRRSTVGALMMIAGLILVVVWMNYVLLSTALSRKRLNVFATHRKLGASKWSLLKLALSESVLINLGAVALAVLFYFLSRDTFSRMLGVDLQGGSLSYLMVGLLSLGLIAVGIVLTAAISSIPMLKVNPALQQQKKIGRNSGSQWLVALQFFTSVFLVIASLTVSKQIRFMQKAELGINLDQVVVLNGAASTHSDGRRRENFLAFRDEVVQLPGVLNGTASMNVPGQALRFRNGSLSRPDRQSVLSQQVPVGQIDDGFLETYGLQLLAGKNFEQPFWNDSTNVLISEKMVQLLGFESPAQAINQQLMMDNRVYAVKGVINDFHHEGLKKPAEPIVFTHSHPFEFGCYSFRIIGDNHQVMHQLNQLWERHYPNDPMDYFYSNDFFNQQYNDEQRLSTILTWFTLFSIALAGLGLYGLVSFFAQQRTREIGIRKVNGATTIDIIRLLFQFFIPYEIAAFLLASPLAWFFMNRWLQGYAYQTPISWWIFLLTGFIALVLSFVSVFTQSLKAARRNPAEAIRYE